MYDPFPIDVYYLGNLIGEEFLEMISRETEYILRTLNGMQKTRVVEFLKPLVDEMVRDGGPPLPQPLVQRRMH